MVHYNEDNTKDAVGYVPCYHPCGIDKRVVVILLGQDLKTRIDEIMRFLNDLPCELIEYEEDYVRTLLEKITVYDDHIIVEFKLGIEIQIDE